MKALTTLSVIALASTSAMALETKMDLKARFDYINTKQETKTTNATAVKSGSGEMNPQFARWYTDAKFNEKVNVKLVLNLAAANAAAGNVVSEFIDEAVWTQSLAPGLSAMIGKQATYMGGFENVASKRDVYLASKYNGQVPDNSTGVGANYTMMDQNLYFQYLEMNSNPGNYTDKKILGAAYVGSFMDGMVSPMLSYYKIGTARLGQYDNHMTAGVQVSAMNVIFQFDYNMLTEQKAGRTSLTAAANSSDAKLKSMVAHVRYNHENFKPFFKYMKEDGEGQSAKLIATNNALESERSAWELGLEFYPNKDEDMNYHLAYNSAEEKETTGTIKTTKETTTIYAGVSFGLNVLK